MLNNVTINATHQVFAFVLALMPLIVGTVVTVIIVSALRKPEETENQKPLRWWKVVLKLVSRPNTTDTHPSSTRMIMFFFALTAIVLAFCITSAWIYGNLTGQGKFELGDMLQLLYLFVFGAVPYGLNRLAEAFGKNKEKPNDSNKTT